VFVIVVSTITNTESLPRWLALACYPLALILLFSIASYDLTALVFPAWVGIVNTVVLVGAARSEGAAGSVREGRDHHD